MSRVEVVMPQMGESVVEGTVSRWLKQVGDDVKRDEPILEISTDKVDAEIPSPSAGTLVEIKVEEGQTVEVQTVVAVLETDGTTAQGTTTTPGILSEERQPTAPTGAQVTTSPIEVTAEPVSSPPPAATTSAIEEAGVETAEERLRRKSTPLVRRIAAEHEVDLGRVRGTGHGGRVTKKDILAFIESRATNPSARGGVAR